jgi:dihydroorotate dehydrogenase
MLPRYDIARTYDWNYVNAPEQRPQVTVPECPGKWSFCGIPVNSPLGIPAGPLLNSKWIHYYATLGFDVLTYKTVRSRFRHSYEPPNLMPVAAKVLDREGTEVEPAHDADQFDTWAISFGMPSRDPEVWRADVERARKGLGRGQVLVVSVVASPEPGWTLDQLAQDFALCAGWAAESGAQAIEANLSCPNVCTQEADLYLSPGASAAIAAAIRARVARLPLILKVGLFASRNQAAAVVAAVSPYAFGGLRRGIGGAAVSARCLAELKMLAGIVHQLHSRIALIGVGGVMNARDVRERIAAGAHHVQLATAPMIDPLAGVKIRAELRQ